MAINIYYGDITKLSVECIVNAANETGLGCFTPNHPCIDNAIHRAAGPQLHEACKKLNGIPTGTAKITFGYKLPAKYIIHTTGPKIQENGFEDHRMLAKCYIECLELAVLNNIKEIAFCCISTGMYGFNKRPAAITAITIVNKWIRANPNKINRIVFVVFTKEDYDLYYKYVPLLSTVI